jgi:hypothetical protein
MSKVMLLVRNLESTVHGNMDTLVLFGNELSTNHFHDNLGTVVVL